MQLTLLENKKMEISGAATIRGEERKYAGPTSPLADAMPL